MGVDNINPSAALSIKSNKESVGLLKMTTKIVPHGCRVDPRYSHDADDRTFVLPSNEEENNCPSCRPPCVLDTVIGGCAPLSSFTKGGNLENWQIVSDEVPPFITYTPYGKSVANIANDINDVQTKIGAIGFRLAKRGVCYKQWYFDAKRTNPTSSPRLKKWCSFPFVSLCLLSILDENHPGIFSFYVSEG